MLKTIGEWLVADGMAAGPARMRKLRRVAKSIGAGTGPFLAMSREDWEKVKGAPT
jgi:hypothetical protein